ncbi:MAG: DNA recombination protein RmuC [Tenericutes bacterium]|nr:DNA recombination protein RmuC [Mycoplasmatota bacterium]
MEYAIIGILVVILILIIVLIIRVNKNREEDISLSKVEGDIIREIGDFKLNFSRDLTEDFNKLNDRIENKLEYINGKVNERLDVNFEKTNKTFANVLERLAKIDEAQKKIDNLSNDIVSLQSVLTDKKSRGIFGEVNLHQILASVFGEKNNKLYSLQYTLSTGVIADAIVFAPEPLGRICIDSKFPLENYRYMLEKGLTDEEKIRREKLFESDVKKHIDAIGSKYVLPGETSDQAIMFLPAEAIFAEINAYHPNLINYAYQRHVYIASPTTLMSLLTIVQAILMGMERDKYAGIIHNELNKLGEEFLRYKDRWDKLSSHMETVSKDVRDIHITTDKITKRFTEISNAKIDKKQIEGGE